MFVLRFTFENHKSFREEVDLTLALPSLRTNVPVKGSWVQNTSRVAAIYGPNASGKSGVLDALRYMRAAVAHSATNWSKSKRLPRAPFALDDSSRERQSSFVLDFVLDDVRHTFGFALTSNKIIEEWLYTYPAGRKRILFERGSEKETLKWGRELGGGGPWLNRATSDRELVLSRGALIDHPVLKPIFDSIVNGIDIASFGESDRHGRLRSVIEDVADGSLSLDDLHTMLRVADVGISGAEVEEGEMDPKVLKVFRAVLDVQMEDGDRDSERKAPSDEEVEEIFSTVARSLMFKHVGADEITYPLTSADQSTGTLTWLSLAAPAIKTIREGSVLAIDELDASLHPQLAQVMIQMFRDESVNTRGAQLIFTTHDTYFISPASDTRLLPEEVWLVEKMRDGVSDLYRLADFSTRDDHNLSRRYLQGRFGAVPSVAPSFLAALARGPKADTPEPELI